MKYLLVLLVVVLSFTNIFSQVKDYDLGTPNLYNRQTTSGYFDFADPFSINFKVSVWGYVKFPGRYNVPNDISVVDLLSYAGGPNDDAVLDELRLYRVRDDGTQELIKFDYEDIWREDKLRSPVKELPELQAGDILVVPGDPRLYFKDWFSITISTIGTLISLATLIIVLTTN